VVSEKEQFMNLCQALRINSETRAALVGAGGKTTILFQLARQWVKPVIVSCSTHLGKWQVILADRHFVITSPDELDNIVDQMNGVVLITGPVGEDERVNGLPPLCLERLHHLCSQLNVPMLIEADGARQKPLKAPASHEPEIPSWVNHVVVVAGMQGIGKPLTGDTVHRVNEFSRLSGLEIGETITLDGLVKVFIHPEGGMKNMPRGAKRSLIFSQVDSDQRLPELLRIADSLTNTYHSITACSPQKQVTWFNIEPITGIILAAGSANRFGQPKLLLNWKGKPLIQHVVETALKTRLHHIKVVVGAVNEPIRQAFAGLPVDFIYNPAWQEGQSTSVREGILSLDKYTGAAIFLLADQPNISVSLVDSLLSSYQRSQAPITAPSVNGRLANPVLFDRVTFPDLLQIKGDTGGRAIFGKYSVEELEWNDPYAFLDVDTPDDYRKLRDLESS